MDGLVGACWTIQGCHAWPSVAFEGSVGASCAAATAGHAQVLASRPHCQPGKGAWVATEAGSPSRFATDFSSEGCPMRRGF